jgi:hypothetical protein
MSKVSILLPDFIILMILYGFLKLQVILLYHKISGTDLNTKKIRPFLLPFSFISKLIKNLYLIAPLHDLMHESSSLRSHTNYFCGL